VIWGKLEVSKNTLSNPKNKHGLAQEIERFSFATALDLNIGYYTIRLDPDASKICTIIFPWGKYSYKQLPMGIARSPDIFPRKDVGADGILGVCKSLP
jgi:hypothetical protein